MKRRRTKKYMGSDRFLGLAYPPKDCKKCIYKNCPDKKSNSGCMRYVPKRGA